MPKITKIFYGLITLILLICSINFSWGAETVASSNTEKMIQIFSNNLRKKILNMNVEQKNKFLQALFMKLDKKYQETDQLLSAKLDDATCDNNCQDKTLDKLVQLDEVYLGLENVVNAIYFEATGKKLPINSQLMDAKNSDSSQVSDALTYNKNDYSSYNSNNSDAKEIIANGQKTINANDVLLIKSEMLNIQNSLNNTISTYISDQLTKINLNYNQLFEGNLGLQAYYHKLKLGEINTKLDINNFKLEKVFNNARFNGVVNFLLNSSLTGNNLKLQMNSQIEKILKDNNTFIKFSNLIITGNSSDSKINKLINETIALFAKLNNTNKYLQINNEIGTTQTNIPDVQKIMTAYKNYYQKLLITPIFEVYKKENNKYYLMPSREFCDITHELMNSINNYGEKSSCTDISYQQMLEVYFTSYSETPFYISTDNTNNYFGYDHQDKYSKSNAYFKYYYNKNNFLKFIFEVIPDRTVYKDDTFKFVWENKTALDFTIIEHITKINIRYQSKLDENNKTKELLLNLNLNNYLVGELALKENNLKGNFSYNDTIKNKFTIAINGNTDSANNIIDCSINMEGTDIPSQKSYFKFIANIKKQEGKITFNYQLDNNLVDVNIDYQNDDKYLTYLNLNGNLNINDVAFKTNYTLSDKKLAGKIDINYENKNIFNLITSGIYYQDYLKAQDKFKIIFNNNFYNDEFITNWIEMFGQDQDITGIVDYYYEKQNNNNHLGNLGIKFIGSGNILKFSAGVQGNVNMSTPENIIIDTPSNIINIKDIYTGSNEIFNSILKQNPLLIPEKRANIEFNDTSKRAKITQLSTALEMYFNDNGGYPVQTGLNTIENIAPKLTPTYIGSIPKLENNEIIYYASLTRNNGKNAGAILIIESENTGNYVAGSIDEIWTTFKGKDARDIEKLIENSPKTKKDNQKMFIIQLN